MGDLRLAYSRKICEQPPVLTCVPSRKLPIVSMEELRLCRLRAQLVHIAASRPLLFELFEAWVSEVEKEIACAREGQQA